MKKLIKFAVISVLVITGLNAEDLLLKATNGKVGETSIGIKVLNPTEMKNIKGGYYSSGAFTISSLINKGHMSLRNYYNSTGRQRIYSSAFIKGYYGF